MSSLLHQAADRADEYLKSLRRRRAFPSRTAIADLQRFHVPLQEDPIDPGEVLRQLDEIGSPAATASAGGRYFGFVIGGSLPASVACNILATAWDQNAGLNATSPVASALESVAGSWLIDVLGLPSGTAVGFVTAATTANFTALAAARHAVLEDVGWDVENKGLFGAPPVSVVVGDEVHVSLLKALGMLGFGRRRVIRAPVDSQGRMRSEGFPSISGPAIVCLQAGNVNTGACDPFSAIIPQARAAGAWVHVDGAFGLWAAASPRHASLVAGVETADSWALDAHKWLNAPYDSGLVFVRNEAALRSAMVLKAAYLIGGDQANPCDYTPELSRRARGVEVWAALLSLGRAGLAELIDRCCRHAESFARGLAEAGHRILNEVVLNQVLVSFGTDEITQEVIRRVQEDGTCWCGSTTWQRNVAMRISVSSWATTPEDVELSLQAILRCAGEVVGRSRLGEGGA
jgi:glutamate/tyrosine decarboxylase-like PLP-dependent enzyme